MTTPAPVTRPNGKVWRGRKPIRIAYFLDPWDDEGIVVLGTHDVDAALAIIGDTTVFEYGCTREGAELDWWRRVPWPNPIDGSWITDEERGTPCVVFAP